MEKRTYKEAVDLTVKWWVEKAFKTPLNQDNGDKSEGGNVSFVLLNTLSLNTQAKITPQKIEKFESKLTELLLEAEECSKSNPGSDRRYFNELDVDYNPNKILLDACRFAEISTFCLPVKTFTYIDENCMVKGRNGYGAEWFEI